jgi:hypothetical protein
MHYDENYYLNIAQNYADRGELTPYMWRLGDVNIISGSGSGYGIVLLAVWMGLVGDSLFWGRILMVFAGLFASGIMYLTARIWWGSHLAGIAAFIFGIVSTSSFYTLILRMDAIGVLMYSAVLLLHIYAMQRNSKWLHFGLGILAVFVLEFHILGLLYLAALAVYYLIQYLKEVISGRRIILDSNAIYFGLGASLAGLLYAAIHIFPDPNAYFIISRECFECNEPIFITEFKRVIRLLVFRPHEVLILVLILVAALARRRAEDRHYLIVLIGWIIAQAIIGPPPYASYSNHIWPFMALGVAGLVDRGFNNRISRMRITVGIITAFVLLGANLGMYILGDYPYLISYGLNESEAAKYIRQTVPTETVVMGRVPSFYYLRDYRNFVTYRDGDIYGIELRGEKPIDFWRRVQPQVILLEEQNLAEDGELVEYMHEFGFVHIMPNLWFSRNLQILGTPGIYPGRFEE